MKYATSDYRKEVLAVLPNAVWQAASAYTASGVYENNIYIGASWRAVAEKIKRAPQTQPEALEPSYTLVYDENSRAIGVLINGEHTACEICSPEERTLAGYRKVLSTACEQLRKAIAERDEARQEVAALRQQIAAMTPTHNHESEKSNEVPVALPHVDRITLPLPFPEGANQSATCAVTALHHGGI